MRKQTKYQLTAVMGALTVTVMVGKWAIYYAYLKRGYKAVGGEYLLILVTYLMVHKGIHYFLNGRKKHAGRYKKRRSRKVVRWCDYR